MLIDAKDLKPGMVIDLEGDPYADPYVDLFADPNGEELQYESEYAVVDEITSETDDCMLVTLSDGQQIGFPPEHSLLFIASE